MAPWVDPKDTDEDAWGAGTGDRQETTPSTVLERAFETARPYQHREEVRISGRRVGQEFETHYTEAQVQYDGVVDEKERTKLLAKGHFWSDGSDHQWFKSQYRREPSPTETDPFDEYSVWTQYKYGTVDRDDDGEFAFHPDDDRTGETVRTRNWTDLYDPVRLRLAELELVRNPQLARYVLRERDQWDDVRTELQYRPDAFDQPP